MKRVLLLAAAATLAAACQSPAPEPLKPRIVVLTDIGPAEVEPDDNESAVRLLAYADRIEIEALVTTIGWNCDRTRRNGRTTCSASSTGMRSMSTTS